MTTETYNPPVSALLTLGDPRGQELVDYLDLGLGPDHVAELGRMVLDEDLWMADSESLEVWSAIHAWRALAQIGSVDAIPALMTRLARIQDDEDDDWSPSELPEVFAAIGPASIPALKDYLDLLTTGDRSYTAASNCITAVGVAHPQSRDECIGVLVGQLENFEKLPRHINGFLIADLLDFHAVEAADVMERAFAAGCFENSIAGDWEVGQQAD